MGLPSAPVNPLAPALIEAAAAFGMPTVLDLNAETMEGIGGAGMPNLIERDGRRVSMAIAYIRPFMDRWNRGAYLVNGLGHCGGCHSPRNLLGAEKQGSRQFAGGFADGWEAPSLTASSHAPISWSAAELFDYLRTGASRFHGAAAGPMQPVIAGLAQLPDSDIRAMAHYVASFSRQLPEAQQREMADLLQDDGRSPSLRAHEAGARLFEGACAACHDPPSGSLAAARPTLALNTNLDSATATNTLRAVLDGVSVPGLGQHGAMPSFRARFDDRQIADLLGYLRARFAGDRPAWTGLAETAGRVREGH